MTAPPLRPAAPEDYARLADLWAERWADAHAAYSPPELIALRTRADFLRRLHGFGPGLRVLGPPGAPDGFCAILGDHLDQLYVSRALAGTGAARRLMTHALSRIAAAGHPQAVLDCNPSNARAAAFYRKTGWSLRGTETVELNSAAGPYPMPLLIFTMDLAPPRPAVAADLAPLARLFHAAWHEAHGPLVPPAVLPQRNLAWFARRIGALGDTMRTAGPEGAPLGFCAVKGAEVDLLFTAPEARGTPVAAALLAEAEARLAAAGVAEAEVACLDGNARAARFYAREGWQAVEVTEEPMAAEGGPFVNRVITFRKRLAPGP